MNILPVDPDCIPEQIKQSKRLVNWDAVKRNGKATKVPKNALTSRTASVNDPDSWSNWYTTWKSYESGKHDGIGIVLGNGLIGIDFDNCRDPKTGQIEPNILKEIKYLNSYTEVSPSGTGLHTYINGNLPEGTRRKGKTEIYDSGRYFTVTGKHLKDTPKQINGNQSVIDSFYNRTFDNSIHPALEKAFTSKNGKAIKSLYEGNHSYNSPSEADLALCGHLSYWTNGNAEEVDKLFRQSGLMRPKWDEKRQGATYGLITINKVLNQPASLEQVLTRKKALKTWGVNDLMKIYDTEIDWIWRTHLAPQEPQMVNGREGSGKTTVCLKMTQEMLEEHPNKYVLWFATEGAVRNTAIKAFEIGLNNERFIVASKENDEFLFNFQQKEDRDLLDVTLGNYDRSVLAVFIDSLRGCSNLDENESQLGKLMIKLNSIVCDKHHAALVYIHHWNKSDKKSYLDRSSGSTAITAAVRHVLSVTPDTKTTRKIVVSKSNIDDQLPELTVIKADKNFFIKEVSQTGFETQKDKSEEFITNLFSQRKEMHASEIISLGEQKGISKDVLNKAKKQLGIESTKVEGGWMWVWPYK